MAQLNGAFKAGIGLPFLIQIRSVKSSGHEIDRCQREIAAAEAALLAGHRDVDGLCLALSDWSAELKILQAEYRDGGQQSRRSPGDKTSQGPEVRRARRSAGLLSQPARAVAVLLLLAPYLQANVRGASGLLVLSKPTKTALIACTSSGTRASAE